MDVAVTVNYSNVTFEESACVIKLMILFPEISAHMQFKLSEPL